VDGEEEGGLVTVVSLEAFTEKAPRDAILENIESNITQQIKHTQIIAAALFMFVYYKLLREN
jgi:hypothetical protein